MIALDKLSGFSRIRDKCSQGIVGRCVLDGVPVVWKVSKLANFTCESEYATGRAVMESTLGVLPHFVKVLSCRDVYLSSEDTVKRTCLTMEDVRGGRFLDVIDNCGECPDTLNIVKQLLIAIAAAQEILQFTHYDLHIENVLVTETDDDKYVYVFPNGTVHAVETNGLCAVVIDYGYAYTSRARTVMPSLYHNEAGFKPYEFSPLADAMTLLCSTVNEFSHSKSPFVTEVERMFEPMRSTMKWECGWFEGFVNLPRELERTMRPPIHEVRKDSVFRNVSLIVDLLQALVPLPIGVGPEEKCDVPYVKTFSRLYYQWFLIEEQLANPELEALFLKTLIRSMLENVSPSELVGHVFGREFEIEYEVVTSALLRMAKMIESGIRKMARRDRPRRDRYYSRLDVSCAMDVYKRLATAPVVFRRDDRVRIFDLRNGTTRTAVASKAQAKRLNNGTLSLEGFCSETSLKSACAAGK